MSPIVPRHGLRSNFPRFQATDPGGRRRLVAGEDNRMLTEQSSRVASEYWLNRRDRRLQKLLPAEHATAMVVSASALNPAADGSWWLQAFPESMQGGFKDLPQVRCGIRGSAFLVTRRHLVTAAHVVDAAILDRAAFIFGVYASDLRPAANGLPERFAIPADRVYYGKSIFTRSNSPTRDDIAVIELKREPPAKHAPLAIAALESVQDKQEVALVGHARMQPLTITAARTGSVEVPHVMLFDQRVIHTNVDSFQGNSGSALLTMDGDVLGVQVRIRDEDEGPNNEAVVVSERAVVASAVRMRVIGDYLKEIGATIRA